jgi:hypothetical protein
MECGIFFDYWFIIMIQLFKNIKHSKLFGSFLKHCQNVELLMIILIHND